MPSLRVLLLSSLSLLSICSAEQNRQQQDNGYTILSEIVQGLPEESVTSALKSIPKYREGVFQHGKNAMEAVHRDDPELATKLVGEALVREISKQDLRRRQDTGANSTAVASSTPNGGQSTTVGSTSDVHTPQTSTTGVIVPITKTTTNSAGNTVTTTTSAFQTTAQTSTVVGVTTTNSNGNQITTSQTVPATLVTTTNAQGATITSASTLSTVKVAGGQIVQSGDYTTTDKNGNTVVLSGTRAGELITTTDSKGRTVVLTYHPQGGEVSEIVLKTTRLPGGRQSTITSFQNVGGPQETGKGKGKPGLQTTGNGAARPTGLVGAMVGGVLGVAAVLI